MLRNLQHMISRAFHFNMRLVPDTVKRLAPCRSRQESRVNCYFKLREDYSLDTGSRQKRIQPFYEKKLVSSGAETVKVLFSFGLTPSIFTITEYKASAAFSKASCILLPNPRMPMSASCSKVSYCTAKFAPILFSKRLLTCRYPQYAFLDPGPLTLYPCPLTLFIPTSHQSSPRRIRTFPCSPYFDER